MSIRQNIFAGVFALVVVGPVAFMAMDRDPPVVRVSGKLYPEHPAPGQDVTVEWASKVDRVCHGSVSRTIIDSTGTVHTLDNVPSSYSIGTSIIRSFKLPVSIAWGPARYRAIVRYACNPLHYWWPITVQGPDVAFDVARP